MGATKVRRHWITCIGALCLSGCTPLANVARTVFVEPLEYSRQHADCTDARRNSIVAEAACAEYLSTCDAPCSPDFANGFKAGYAAYLYEGQVNPPPLPPRCYWRPEYENTAGKIAIQDWFNGYRRGVEAARRSGYRELVTIPASTALPKRKSEPAPQAAIGPNPPMEMVPEPPPRYENPPKVEPAVPDPLSEVTVEVGPETETLEGPAGVQWRPAAQQPK